MDVQYKNLVAYNVFKNMPSNYHIEALKCQAIIERTIIFRSIKEGSFKKIEIDNNQDIDEKIYKAVEDTENLVIMVNNNPIKAYYHICCGGSTENSENILNNKIDYLRRVTCNECSKDKNFNKEVDMSLEELAKNFSSILDNDFSKDYSVENIIKIIKRNESQRVETISIFGREVNGIEFSEKLNLDSSRFIFKPKEIRFYAKGSGHGLGLCQYGANEKAKNNWLCEDILKYYYTNINICCVEYFNSNVPLKGKKIFIDPGHGGKDEGYISNTGLKEKDITLKISLNVKNKLEKYGAYVGLSRYKDEYIAVDERIKAIKNHNPDFLISIHLSESKFDSVNGVEGFYYWGDQEGKVFGEEIIKSINKNLNVKNRGIREGKVYILKESGSNGISLELGYLSNSKENENLCKDEFLESIATCIVEGILKYYSNKILT